MVYKPPLLFHSSVTSHIQSGFSPHQISLLTGALLVHSISAWTYYSLHFFFWYPSAYLTFKYPALWDFPWPFSTTIPPAPNWRGVDCFFHLLSRHLGQILFMSVFLPITLGTSWGWRPHLFILIASAYLDINKYLLILPLCHLIPISVVTSKKTKEVLVRIWRHWNL